MSGVVKKIVRKKVSTSQIATMVEYMEKYPELIRGCNNNSDLTREKKNALWEILKDSLNADKTGASKCVYRWQKTWADLKVHLKKKYKKNKKSRNVPALNELDEKLFTMIEKNNEKCETLHVKQKEGSDSTEIKITSVESHQEPPSIKDQAVASTSEQPQEKETTMTTIEDIQPSISCIQSQNSNNSLPFVQPPIDAISNQKQDSDKSLTQFLDTVYFYYKQPTLPTLLVTTQCNPQLDSGNSLLTNQDKSSTCTSILKQNSGNFLSTAFDKSSICNSNKQDSNISNCTISTVQDKPSFSDSNKQDLDDITSDDQDKPSTCNGNTQQRPSHSTKSASTGQSTNTDHQVNNESADNKGFFSCQMMSAKALQTIAKELGVKNDIERKRLELEERKVRAFEMIAQRLQM